MSLSFKLADNFVETYTTKPVAWGYRDAAGNSLGEITFLRTYSRIKPDGSKERWHEVCRRVIEWMYSEQKNHCKASRLPWNDHKAQRSAQDAFDRMFNFKWTPPGRGLWIAGTPMVVDQRNSAALQNCSFVSTADMTKIDPAGPFKFLMEALMLGVGVGFDDKGADKDFLIYEPGARPRTFVIPDTREGWFDSVGVLLESYLMPDKATVEFDYSLIRPAGEPIKTFGGVAAGPGPLKELHDMMRKKFTGRAGSNLSRVDIADIGNQIGVCVVSGNVRRSAELLIGHIDDKEFINLKNPSFFPERNHWSEEDDGQRGWAWMSNNSVEATVGAKYDHFIDGISLNGEPGIIWMDTSRKYGRLIDPPNNKDWRVAGYNPCAEQSLESFEMCVSGHTLIQTDVGLLPIKDLVGQSTRIWNGENWSGVTPFYTGRNELYRVTLSDGSYLDVTPGHEWSVRTNKTYRRVRTDKLKVGDKLPEFSLQNCDGKPAEHAYAWGWVCGDGYIDGTKVRALVCERESEALAWLGNGARYPWQIFKDGTQRFCRVDVTDLMPFDAAVSMRRLDSLPDEVFTWNNAAISEFIGGWIDTDGSLIRNPRTDHYVLYGSEGKLRQAQMLLRRIGVDHSTLRLFQAAGTVTNKGTRNYGLWRLLIPSYEASVIGTRLKVAERFGGRQKVNNAHPTGELIDAARKQKVVRIELINADADTYCFQEPTRGMGVFGNALTYQCTLVETYLNRHDSLEDFQKTLKYAYLYAKVVTLLPTHWERTNAIMQRNRRIGCSVSGVANFTDAHGLPELRTWLNKGYETVQRYDETYSEWLGVRQSIKTTTVKPSGTVSILAGESPGVHWAPGGAYFNRAIRLAKDDALVPLLTEAGYTVEPDVRDQEHTVVAYFPIHTDAKRAEGDVTIFEKANLAVVAQRYWSDNSVSVTLSFDAEKEAQHVGTVIHMHEGQLKTVSFLPMGNTVYPQQPYTKITEQQWDQAERALSKLNLDSIYNGTQASDGIGEVYCTTDSCEIKQHNLNS